MGSWAPGKRKNVGGMATGRRILLMTERSLFVHPSLLVVYRSHSLYLVLLRRPHLLVRHRLVVSVLFTCFASWRLVLLCLCIRLGSAATAYLCACVTARSFVPRSAATDFSCAPVIAHSLFLRLFFLWVACTDSPSPRSSFAKALLRFSLLGTSAVLLPHLKVFDVLSPSTKQIRSSNKHITDPQGTFHYSSFLWYQDISQVFDVLSPSTKQIRSSNKHITDPQGTFHYSREGKIIYFTLAKDHPMEKKQLLALSPAYRWHFFFTRLHKQS
ncbi:hypothetical protein ZWY2020_051152 [Hordeum vulgare]|nr:hypothetical protein ZWY2020_051152 [Hordeum vulgare]